MERNKLELDKCILFPRAEDAAKAIENSEIDSRYEIELIEISSSNFSKLQLYGFFSYPKHLGISVHRNNFVKILASQLPLVIETALESRKQTNDREILKLIDTFVSRAKLSSNKSLPIWFNT